VRLFGRDLIRAFARKHPDSRPSLRTWVQVIEANNFRHFVELKEAFRSVFNIAGDKYRLIYIVEYQLQTVSVEDVLTHEEYEKQRWRAR